jgi:hypothetical protein
MVTLFHLNAVVSDSTQKLKVDIADYHTLEVVAVLHEAYANCSARLVGRSDVLEAGVNIESAEDYRREFVLAPHMPGVSVVVWVVDRIELAQEEGSTDRSKVVVVWMSAVARYATEVVIELLCVAKGSY